MREPCAPLLTCLVLSLFVGLAGCSKPWRSDAIEAQVVDATSGAPVPGAVVLVSWELKGMEGYPQGSLAIFERVTDARGRFQTPAWGPRWPSFMTTVRHYVRVFKNGYEPLVLVKYKNAAENPHVHGQALRLQRFEGSASEYAERMNTFLPWTTLDFIVERCEQRLASPMYQALVQLKREFDAAEIRSSLPREATGCRES